MTLVFGDIRFMRYSREISGDMGRQTTVQWRNRNSRFSVLSNIMSLETSEIRPTLLYIII